MKKICVIYIPIVIFTLQLLLNIFPKIKYIQGNIVLLNIYNDSIIYLAISLFVFFIIYQYVLVSRPYNKFLIIEKLKSKSFDIIANNFLRKIKTECNVDLRINIMMVKRSFITNLEPHASKYGKKKISFFTKKFKVVYTTANMHFHGDSNLTLTVNQGVCGEAFRTREPKIADMTVPDAPSYNLNNDQIKRTKNIKFIVSCPIKKYLYKEEKFSDNIIGVVNIDSITPNSQELLINEQRVQELVEALFMFSKYSSYLL